MTLIATWVRLQKLTPTDPLIFPGHCERSLENLGAATESLKQNELLFQELSSTELFVRRATALVVSKHMFILGQTCRQQLHAIHDARHARPRRCCQQAPSQESGVPVFCRLSPWLQFSDCSSASILEAGENTLGSEMDVQEVAGPLPWLCGGFFHDAQGSCF